jgi:hypothetical protein
MEIRDGESNITFVCSMGISSVVSVMGIRSASTSRKNDSTSALYRLLSSSIFDM